MNGLLTTLYIIGLFWAFAAGFILLRNQMSIPQSADRKLNFPRVTFFLLLAIAIPSVLQFFFPRMLPGLERNYERFLNGDWWRLISALFVQDGGVVGTIFNLVSLAFMGFIAERMWGGRTMLLIFFIGGIAGELAGFAWQPVGAGNSVGNFSLAASIAVASLMRLPPKPARLLAVIALAVVALGADAILLWLRDIHGAAATTGAITALILSQTWPGKKQG